MSLPADIRSSSTSYALASQADGPSSSTATHSVKGAGDSSDEVVLPNMIPAEDDSGKLFYYSFPPWPKQPGMLRIDQFQSQGLINQSWPAGTPRPDDEDNDSEDEEENPHAGYDGSGVPTVHLDIEHFADRKKKRKNRAGRKNKKPRAPRLQMRRKGIVRTEDLFGPGGWDGPELVETRGMEPYDATTPALTRIQRAAREYASSRVHVINAEQTLMQIWSNFLTFAQIDKRPDVEQKPLADEDADFDSDSDGIPEDGQIMYHPEAGLDDEENPTSRFLDDMTATIRMFLSSFYRNRGLHWHDGQLDAGSQVVWSFVKYVKAHGVLMESAYATDFDQVKDICEQARQEMRLTKATPLVFEDGFNKVCARIWGKHAHEIVNQSWPEDAMTAAAANLVDTDPALPSDSSPDGEDTLLEDDDSSGSTSVVDMLARLPTPSSGTDTPVAIEDDADTSVASDFEVRTPVSEAGLEWQIPQALPGGNDVTPDPWSAATQQPGWELDWDVSEYTICQPTTFLEPVLGGGVFDGEWAVEAEHEALMRIGPTGDDAARLPGVNEHFLLVNTAHSLAPVVLEHWEPVLAPFSEPIGSASNEAFLPPAENGSKRLVVWMESEVIAAGQIKPGMGALFELKWVKCRDRTFWFVDKVPICISDYWLAVPGHTSF